MPGSHTLVLSSPFPPDFGFSCVSTEDLGDFRPHPEEMKCLSERATEKRRTEFFLGRLAAFRALQAVGVDPQPVLKAKGREPVWQDGIVGAITHKAGTAVAAVAPRERACGVGVDLEALEPPVRFQIVAKVCTETERTWVEGAPEEKDTRLKMVFSAKEAGFKAFYPIRQIYLGYKDAELRWEEDARRFVGTLRKGAGERHPAGFVFEVGCRVTGGFVFSFVSLPPLKSPA